MIKAKFSLPFYLHLAAFLCRAASCWKKQPNLPGEMVYSDVSGKSSCFSVAAPILLPDPPLPRGSDADSESSQGHKTCLVLESSAGKYNRKEPIRSGCIFPWHGRGRGIHNSHSGGRKRSRAAFRPD